MGEVADEVSSSPDVPLHLSFSKRHEELELGVSVTTTSSEIDTPADWHDYGQNPHEAWLPITESRNGNGLLATFHVLCSGLGMQALVLPVAFASLGWAWGITCLSLAFVWQLYTLWILVRLHEPVPGTRYSRYLHLATAAFGPKLAKWLTIFPIMYLSGGTCALLIILGGGTMDNLFQTICSADAYCHAKSLTGTEWFLVFVCIAILIAQLPNLNFLAGTSVVGAIAGLAFCALLWITSVSKGRLREVSYAPFEGAKSDMEKTSRIMNAIGIISIAFRGHNVILEIQATLPSNPKEASTYKPMWRGVVISYILIALCQFPLAIAGYWAYGNEIPYNGGLLSVFGKFHGEDTSKVLMCLIYVLVIVSCLCTFRIYALPVFDNLEIRYALKNKRRCPRWLRAGIRIFFGGLVYFVAVTFPFLGSLAPLIGGITLPLTLAYPCFMWLSMKKPRPTGVEWFVNLGLGCFGIVLSILLGVAAAWTLAKHGINANFFKP